MNRKQRRLNDKKSMAHQRRAILTGMTATGLALSSFGTASPALATGPIDTTVASCSDFLTALTDLASNGGTLTADFTGNCTLNNSYTMGQASVIHGPNSGVLNLIKHTGPDHLFTATSSFELTHVTLSGESTAGGTFIYEAYGHSGTTTLSHDTFQNNNGGGGAGAIYVEGHIEINDSKFFSNQGTGGGAAFFENASQVTIQDSVFDGNSSNGLGGGAIRNNSTDLLVEGTSFTDNEASSSGNGGAIYSEGSLVVKESTFFNNRAAAGLGGAIALPGYSVDVDNSTFVNNSAADGGALFSEGGIVSNSTYWNNGVSANTGNPTAASIVTNGGSFFANVLANSIDTPMIENGVTDLGANLFTDDSFANTTSGAGASKRVTFASLKLKSLALNTSLPNNSGATKTVALGSDSSALDYYTSTSTGITPSFNSVSRLATTDQRGATRPLDGGYDVGAYERAVETAPTPAPTEKYVGHATVLFHGNSARLTPHAKAQLRALAAKVMANKVHNIALDGHTATLTKADPSGRHLRGKIAGARTRAVQKYLKKQFKKANYSVTITRVIKGAANPVKSNRTEAGRKANRRVYITVK
jgi:predicted outer membrane repeat protein